MLPDEPGKFVLRMAELYRQRFGRGSGARLGSQGKHRCKPLASVGLSPDAKEPVRQITRDGVPKDPVGKFLGPGLPD